MTQHGKPKIDDILHTVANYYGVEYEDILSRRRHAALNLVRQIAMYLTWMIAQHSTPAIGRKFDRDHTTVMHAIRKIKALMLSDAKLKSEIDHLSIKLVKRPINRSRIDIAQTAVEHMTDAERGQFIKWLTGNEIVVRAA